ncbi:MAG TPA: membrane dipeptidase [Verrucomicrobiae bacterium]|nr:membrane dipeptidase [Verrucomicrobiae bacterium]
MLTFDAHLDLAMNAMEWNRDLTQPIDVIRQREQGVADKPDRGRNTVCFPEMRRGGIGICVATQIARFVKPGNKLPGWHSPQQAWAQTQCQLGWYRAMEEAGHLAQITSATQLLEHVHLWQTKLDAAKAGKPNAQIEGVTPGHMQIPIAYILSLEGADSLLTMRHLERAYEQGLRAIGPAHYGPGTYAQGTDAAGGLGPPGRELLSEMDRLGMILDASHLCDESFWETLELFQGPVWASHSNCRALVPHNRQLADPQIKALVERGAIIGCALDGWMLVPGWVRGKTTPQSAGLNLTRVIDHIDHICQIAGNARHSGIGSDLDGAFGREQSPADLDTIADLANLSDLLKARGYPEEDIRQIMHGNFLSFLTKAWS